MFRSLSKKSTIRFVSTIIVVTVVINANCLLTTANNNQGIGDSPKERSADLNADIKRMWETAEGVSTLESISAARRVFATVDLVGLSRSQIVSIIGDPTSERTNKYYFPFYPSDHNDLVYRFDNGLFGCQYNIVFDWHGRARKVQYRTIE
jgi:hypothetical protein